MESIMRPTFRGVISIVLRILGVIGLALVFLASLYLAARLRAHSGPFMVLVMAIGFGAAWAATDESRAMAQRVKRTLLDLGWSLKEAAIRAGMAEAQLCRQLSGQEQMSLSRFAEWGDEFWFRFSSRVIEDRGGVVFTDKRLIDIFTELQRLSGASEGRWKGAA